MKRLAFLLALALPALVLSQFDSGEGPGTGIMPSEGPISNILTPLRARPVGPTTMGGRITDIAVYEKEPRIYYVASASGGVYKTENAGLTFTTQFDQMPTVSIGAIAISQQDPNIVWVGTGEATSRNSVAWGDGVYKSTDGGKTWTHMGLKETMHISRIIVDPRNPDVVWVGALGRLWGTNPERGLFKTTDGGKTWTHALAVDDKTGVIDIAMDPKNPNNMLVAKWQRIRSAYDFTSGGPGSGLFRTTDGGRNWRKVTKGIPNQNLGRIGLSYFHKNPKVVIATIEHGRLPDESGPAETGVIRNQGGGIYRSTDGGDSWTRISTKNPRPFYFSMPKQDPVNENRIYLPAVNMEVSDDSAKTWRTIASRVHSDYHAMWIDPRDNNYMIVGTDGGVYTSRDAGATWDMHTKMSIGQFYAVAFDMRKPYWVYGGLQDNGSWGVPTQTTRGGVSFYDAIFLSGGDGFHVQADPEDWRTVYTESQGGAIQRVDLGGGPSRGIRPRLQGETLRWNWSTPFIISPHNSKTLYIGGNRLFRTINRGDTWEVISPDLTTNDPAKLKPGVNSVTPEDTGAERHCTIITISESPRRAGTIWVGTDDGQVQLTQDAGKTWTNLTANIPGVPANTWVSRVLASKYEEGRAYVTFDGHRANDFKPYVFVTEDFGKTWKSLAAGLPDYDSIYVITEGEQNPDLLFLGSEMSLRVSLDRGQTWSRYRGNFPTVAVHDLKIHPRELDLVIGTHGRSIWTLDVSALEGLTRANLDKDVALLRPSPVYNLGRMSGAWFGGDSVFQHPNSQPGTRIYYHLKKAVEGPVTVRISDAADTMTMDLNGTNTVGLNAVNWNGRIDGRMVPAGDYRVTLLAGGNQYVTSVKVEDLSPKNE